MTQPSRREILPNALTDYLEISVRTVENHISHILDKKGFRNRVKSRVTSSSSHNLAALGDFTHNRTHLIKLFFTRVQKSVANMTKQHISEGLKTFIREKIQTVLRLEVLLLLHYQQSRSFTVAEVADELNLEKETAKDQLTALEAVGVVAQSNADKPRYRYQPLNASLRSMVEQLAVGYSKQRVPILSVILSKHSDRTRLFAEAFGIIRRSD